MLESTEIWPRWVGGSYLLAPCSKPSDPALNGTRGQIQFLAPKEGGQQQEPLYRYMDNNKPEGSPITNEQHQDTEIDVWNGRIASEKDSFGLHTTGFLLGTHQVPMPVAPTSDDLEGINSWVREHALPSACKLVRTALGESAVAVAVFDYTMRFQVPPKNPPSHLMFREPIAGAHADFTDKSGPLRMHKILANEDGQGIVSEMGSIALADANKDKDNYRFVFVNLWQPLREVYKRPLAVCDARTSDLSDLYERCFIFKERKGYTYAVAHNPNQKWYYFPRMTPDEAIVFKVFDSEVPPPEGGPHYTTPHVGMRDLSTESLDLPPRESVEIRTIVVMRK